MHNLPCLLIGFAREENLLSSVEQGISLGIRKFYVSLDGPTSSKIKSTQLKIISRLQEIADRESIEINVQLLEENLGSGAAVIAAVNWMMSFEESGIILEDDLKVQNDLFYFLKECLSAIKDDDRVLAVSGFNPFLTIHNDTFGYKVKYPVSWGWATTRKKWNQIKALIFESVPRKASLHPVLASYWKTGKSRALTGSIDAWDVPLAATMRFSNFYTILPPVNLVTNIGSDEFAAHTTQLIWPIGLASKPLPLNWMLSPHTQFPDLTKYFERDIYKISLKNLLSLPASILLDSFRFKKRRAPLEAKIVTYEKTFLRLGNPT